MAQPTAGTSSVNHTPNQPGTTFAFTQYPRVGISVQEREGNMCNQGQPTGPDRPARGRRSLCGHHHGHRSAGRSQDPFSTHFVPTPLSRADRRAQSTLSGGKRGVGRLCVHHWCQPTRLTKTRHAQQSHVHPRAHHSPTEHQRGTAKHTDYVRPPCSCYKTPQIPHPPQLTSQTSSRCCGTRKDVVHILNRNQKIAGVSTDTGEGRGYASVSSHTQQRQ